VAAAAIQLLPLVVTDDLDDAEQQQQRSLGATVEAPVMAAIASSTATATATAAPISTGVSVVMSAAPQQVDAELSRLRCEVSSLRSCVGDLRVTCSSLQEVRAAQQLLSRS
jgi:hypothetical protein